MGDAVNNNFNGNIINSPPVFSGKSKELEGFLTRVELIFQLRPNVYNSDRVKVAYVISFLVGKPLEWASYLIKNGNNVLNVYDEFKNSLKNNFGGDCYEVTVANNRIDNIRQRQLGHVQEYILNFQRLSQKSNFNDKALIHCFLKGLQPRLREKLAFIDPDPTTLDNLYSSAIRVESLMRMNSFNEFYYTGRTEDPMDVDVYSIRKKGRQGTYLKNEKVGYNEGVKNFSEEKRKGLCFRCKKKGHNQYNCPNRIKPKQVLRIVKETHHIRNCKILMFVSKKSTRPITLIFTSVLMILKNSK